ncbi:MAG TPA: hypothetical protein VHG89_12670 [Verrucomicrobiae bacterium]|nr:hypothetical protein [Verrucomicrobiae bacterium]
MDTFGGDPDSNAFIRITSDTDDWTRHFQIGAMAGLNIKANFSEHGSFGVSGNNPAEGIFDNGFVRTDSSGNAFDHTSYWGYNNASQYNPASQTLSMQSTTSYSTSGSAEGDNHPFVGFEMAYGDNLWYWKHARVGWELGFGLLPIDIKDNSSMDAAVNSSIYTFDASQSGISSGDSSPLIGTSGSGYSGNFNRLPHESTISSSPSSITSLPSTDGTVTGTRELDLMLYTLRLGPTFYWDLTEHFGVSLGAGPTIGLAAGKYKYDETITANNISAHNKGSFDTTGFTFGGYVNGTVMYHIMDWNGKTGDIFASAQYMPMKDVSFGSGGREAQLRLGEQLLFSVGINWPF